MHHKEWDQVGLLFKKLGLFLAFRDITHLSLAPAHLSREREREKNCNHVDVVLVVFHSSRRRRRRSSAGALPFVITHTPLLNITFHSLSLSLQVFVKHLHFNSKSPFTIVTTCILPNADLCVCVSEDTVAAAFTKQRSIELMEKAHLGTSSRYTRILYNSCI